MKITHKKNEHRAKPSVYKIYYRPNSITVDLELTESCKYQLNGVDQGDWNKLIGVTSGVLGDASKCKTLMIGWRYLDGFEFGIYAHNPPSTHRILPEENNSILKSKSLKNHLEVLISDKIIFDLNGQTIQIPNDLKFNFSRLVNPWFGGNNPAPQDIVFQINYKIT